MNEKPYALELKESERLTTIFRFTAKDLPDLECQLAKIKSEIEKEKRLPPSVRMGDIWICDTDPDAPRINLTGKNTCCDFNWWNSAGISMSRLVPDFHVYAGNVFDILAQGKLLIGFTEEEAAEVASVQRGIGISDAIISKCANAIWRHKRGRAEVIDR
jgi:hypothetical protein